MQMDLFDFQLDQSPAQENRPLAEKMRPQELQEFRLSGDSQKTVTQTVELIKKTARIPNLILWGPPGSGKTTLALLLAKLAPVQFLQLNAVDTGAKQLKQVGLKAKQDKKYQGKQTVVFIDEIHRLNKAQQDVLLPFTELGDLSLIGATTENPGYELNGALLSRSRVIVLEPHSDESLQAILQSAASSRLKAVSDLLTNDSQRALLAWADGDARKALNALEQVMGLESAEPLALESLARLLGDSQLRYDKAADEHYDSISAFIKSIRGSDPDAAVYYLARMLAGGEDAKFIARRLVILASEDIGNADPRALSLATSGFDAVERVGMPEAAITLSQVTCYLASCPKSNRAYVALRKAQEIVKQTGNLPIPKALRSAQTSFAQKQGYGEGYEYSHDGVKGFVAQQFLPDAVANEKFYEPTQRGFEKSIQEYLKWMKS
jgi:putative ATPase